jgi:hypothetical protein
VVPAGGAAVSVALAELLAVAGHQGSDAQCLRDAGADRADRPHPAAAGVGALARCRAEEGKPGQQQVAHLHICGGGGALIGQRDGEDDRVAHVGRRVAHRFRHREVGRLGRFGGAGGVVGRVRVELVGVADGRGVCPRAVAGHQGSDAQCLRDAGADRADRPPAAAGVGALARCRAEEGKPSRQQVAHLHIRGGGGALIGQRDGEDDRVAHVGRRVAHRFRRREVSQRRRHCITSAKDVERSARQVSVSPN